MVIAMPTNPITPAARRLAGSQSRGAPLAVAVNLAEVVGEISESNGSDVVFDLL